MLPVIVRVFSFWGTSHVWRMRVKEMRKRAIRRKNAYVAKKNARDCQLALVLRPLWGLCLDILRGKMSQPKRKLVVDTEMRCCWMHFPGSHVRPDTACELRNSTAAAAGRSFSA